MRAVAFSIASLAAAASAATITVQVGPGLSFSQKAVNIAVGDTINWESQGGTHDVALAKSVDEPCVAADGGWKSDIFSSSMKSYPQTFSKAGTYAVYCTVGDHCKQGMWMRVIVGGSSSGTPSGSATVSPSSSSVPGGGAATVSAFGSVAAVAVAGALAATQLF